MDPERLGWLALNSVKQVGAVRLRALLQAFGSAEAAWQAAPGQWSAAGMPPAVVRSFSETKNRFDPQRLLADLEKNSVSFYTLQDEGYPRRLKDLDQAPPVLFLRGSLIPEDEWAVAIVGTRNVTAYGRQVAEELGAFLAHNGITVVSGLARGVDALSHNATLKAGGRTLAVVAHGLDSVYPADHRQLAERIAASGALVSDYALGTPPDAANFPPRNRIISGLSLAVVIVEAGEKSGALITAGFAAEQGRETFAVPGSIYGPQSKGTNMLLQRGAHPLVSFEDLLQTLDLEMMGEMKAARITLPADATEAKLFGLLGQEPLHVNEIGIRAALPIEQVSSALALMELKGLVRQVGGMHYVAAREARSEYHAGPANP